MVRRLYYRLFGWRVNMMFAAQQPGHWLHKLLTPLRLLWLAGRLFIGLTRGIGPAADGDEAYQADIEPAEPEE